MGLLIVFSISLVWQWHCGTALVPHPFWNARGTSSSIKKNRRCATGQMGIKMYFDDCEREDNVTPFPAQQSNPNQRSWIPSEKQAALARLFPNYRNSLNLDEELIEEETLQWSIDTNVLWDGEEENKARSKYLTLSDLIIESSCTKLEECLASLWQNLASLLEKNDVNSVKWLVFPRCEALWDYDKMVTLLQAIRVSRPQIEMEVQLELFHPNYKHSPSMFSPETHSPFPTVALQVRNSRPQINDDDAAVTLSKLQALFDSVDAVPETKQRRLQLPKNISEDKVLQDCHLWLDAVTDDDMEWVVEPHQQPFMLYAAVWNVIQRLGTRNYSSTAMVVAPNCDAHTQHRVAVSINVALQRLDSRVRIANVYHPDSPLDSRKSPHSMIQLTYK